MSPCLVEMPWVVFLQQVQKLSINLVIKKAAVKYKIKLL
jgi:hypothetical protein